MTTRTEAIRAARDELCAAMAIYDAERARIDREYPEEPK